MKNKIELLAPAGDKERAYFALEYGADAIYLGAKQYSLRARSSNFELDDIDEIVKYAHQKNKKVYLVTNVICHNTIGKDFIKFLEKIAHIDIDGFICADPYIIQTIKKILPNREIHISTQQSVTNSKAAMFWKDNGAIRVVLGREIKFEELRKTCSEVNNQIEIEVFIHGAVCIAYSGRCMMSNNYSLRDSNIGGCAQSCRWEYDVLSTKINHSFTMSAKDMAYIDYIKNLSDLNIASFKIEGRMKTINYLATVVKCYRQVLDDIDSSENIAKNKQQLLKVANRETSTAFLIDADKSKMLYHDVQKVVSQQFIFNVVKKISNNEYEIITKNYFDINQDIIMTFPVGPDQTIKIEKIFDLNKNEYVDVINTPMTSAIITLKKPIEMNQFCLGRIRDE